MAVTAARAVTRTAYLKRGTSVCGNGLRLPRDRIDNAVLKTLAGDVVRPAVVMAIVDGMLEAVASREVGLRARPPSW